MFLIRLIIIVLIVIFHKEIFHFFNNIDISKLKNKIINFDTNSFKVKDILKEIKKKKLFNL